MKKVRAAALIAVVTTAVSSARDYARANPDQAGQAVDKVEDYLRGRLAPRHGAYLDKGSAALRQGLGLPGRSTRPASVQLTDPETDPVPLTDPDPDTAEQWPPHAVGDPVARTPHRAPVTTRSRAAGTTTRHPSRPGSAAAAEPGPGRPGPGADRAGPADPARRTCRVTAVTSGVRQQRPRTCEVAVRRRSAYGGNSEPRWPVPLADRPHGTRRKDARWPSSPRRP